MDSKLPYRDPPHEQPRKRAQRSSVTRLHLLFYGAGLLTALALVNLSTSYTTSIHRFSTTLKSRSHQCHPPLPPLLAHLSPQSDHHELTGASHELDRFLSRRTAKDDIDSLSIAVVTPDGPVFQRGYGLLKANETDHAAAIVDKDSIYRIASITKMFTVLETLILRERGVLSWDDPVTKFLPNFTFPSYGWAEHLRGNESKDSNTPITLRQLASHMSGLGRDLPHMDLENWPSSGIPSVGNLGAREDILKSIATHPLMVPQYTYPIYSNTGTVILGACNVAANRLVNGNDEPDTHAELIKRDIFDVLGLDSSFYTAPEDMTVLKRIAVPSKDFNWTDMIFGDTMDPAGGQFSSLGDLTKVMQSFLSPNPTKAAISPYVLREWLRPLHTWSDGAQEVGAIWEIDKIADRVPLYMKGGNLPGYHSLFALNPQYSYGVIVLITGTYADSVTIAKKALSYYQPAFSKILESQMHHRYAGEWKTSGGDSESSARVVLRRGDMFLERLVVRGEDVLAIVQETARRPDPVALWSTGRVDEFRMAFGRPELNNVPGSGCEPYWISIDPGVSSHGAPVDLIYFNEDGELVYPSANIHFTRESKR